MSAILDKLLKGQKVEWLPLGEALKRTKGTSITAGQMKELHKDNAPVKIFAGGKTFAMVNYEDIPNKDINNKPSIIVKSRGIIEFEYYDKPFSHKNEMWAYHSQNPKIATKYVYYFLKTKEAYFQNIGSKMQMPQIATPDTDKFLIPIPPLEVQAKIVRILDAFTAVTAELTAELNMREKQYQYYRDKLLTFSDDVNWVKIGHIATIKGRIGFRGYTVEDFVDKGEGAISLSPGNMVNGRFDFDSCKYISWNKYEESPEIQIKTEEVIFVKTGSTAGKVAYVSHLPEKSTLNPQLVVFKNLKCNSKFLFYVLNLNTIQKQISALAKGAIPNISQTALSKIEIPLPSTYEQNRIVCILDKFEALTYSITEGLPKEIALRQQQYEYYREQLLDFPKN